MNEIPELDRFTDKVLAFRPAKLNQQKGKEMAEIREIDADGAKVKAIEIPFEIREEDWAEYAFMDGGGLRFRSYIRRIWQVVEDDGTPVRQPNGDRYIIVEYQVDHVDTTT